MTVEKLVSRMRFCDRRWSKAMVNPNYRDEPSEDRPFTEENKLRYWWADSWRKLFHQYESALYQEPEVRRGMVEGLVTREPLTVYEAEADQ